MGQDPLRRRDCVGDFDVTQSLQLKLAVYKHRLEDTQPVITQIDSMSNSNLPDGIARSIDCLPLTNCTGTA